ncbi:hypothetical protein HF521_017089 [Silurus meridionalis]|uniref:WKF domain-containing protein n=1 Tax=Silurus meridionalis TaxID=175797 RepID=A0A8T0BL88_SILME|nr:hypothetical protein HF521_017089 [Silurus meridionalis]
MKRKKTPETPDVCVPVSATTKKKLKERVGERRHEDLTGKKKPEACEDVILKKKRKERPGHVDDEESADVVESRQSGELVPAGTEMDGVEDEEELSPEEMRVLERKLKKIRKKEEKKKQKEEAKGEKEESKSSVAQTQALEYLTCWSEKRDEWKFQKTRQVWLLQHMYDSEKVSDSHFSVLLSYLEGLRASLGRSRCRKQRR